jgi:hypothetical protein
MLAFQSKRDLWGDSIEAVLSWLTSPAHTASHDDALGTVPRPAFSPAHLRDIFFGYQPQLRSLALASFLLVLVGVTSVRVLLGFPAGSSTSRPNRRRPHGPPFADGGRPVRGLTICYGGALLPMYSNIMSIASVFGSFGRSGGDPAKQSEAQLLQKNREKLKSYHELAHVSTAVRRSLPPDARLADSPSPPPAPGTSRDPT